MKHQAPVWCFFCPPNVSSVSEAIDRYTTFLVNINETSGCPKPTAARLENPFLPLLFEAQVLHRIAGHFEFEQGVDADIEVFGNELSRNPFITFFGFYPLGHERIIRHQ